MSDEIDETCYADFVAELESLIDRFRDRGLTDDDIQNAVRLILKNE